MDGTMAFFRRTYANKRTAFMPAWYFLTDGPDEFITKRFTRRVFVPIAVKNHWCVLCLDLDNHEISFGDPFGEPAPHNIIMAVINWIRPNEVEYWEFAMDCIKEFPVERLNGGSADILAAVAIEGNINRLANWKGLTVNGYRTRYLRLLVVARSTEGEDQCVASRKTRWCLLVCLIR
jgi:hypothetical protein